MPRLCKSCGTYPRQLVADKSKPSVKIGEFMFVYPNIELDHCYFCHKQKSGLFETDSNIYRRGNLVNHHEDGNYPMKGIQDGLY